MRRVVVKIIVISIIINMILASIPVTAQSSFLYSVRAQKFPDNTLDGYNDAKKISVTNLNTKDIYIKNTEGDLYIAFRVTKNVNLTGIALLFDVDHDQIYADDVKILFTNQSEEDGYFYQNSSISMQASTYFTSSITPINYIDGKQYNFFQFDIPLNPSSSPTTDMYISDPTDYMLGFDFVEIMNNGLISWTRGNLGAQDAVQKLTSDATSYYSMVLAGPGKFAVPDFNPDTAPQATSTYTASSSGTNANDKITYGQAASSPGFEVVFPVLSICTIILIKKLRRNN